MNGNTEKSDGLSIHLGINKDTPRVYSLWAVLVQPLTVLIPLFSASFFLAAFISLLVLAVATIIFSFFFFAAICQPSGFGWKKILMNSFIKLIHLIHDWS